MKTFFHTRTLAPTVTMLLLAISIAACGGASTSEEVEQNVQPDTLVTNPTPETMDQMPEMVGGMAAIAARIVYPPEAQTLGLEGQVMVQFVVPPSGTPTDLEVLMTRITRDGSDVGMSDVDSTMVEAIVDLEESAMTAVGASPFTPGSQNGRVVSTRMVLPITYRLQ